RRETPIHGLDQVGRQMVAHLHALLRPTTRLRNRARQICAQAGPLRGLDEAALNERIAAQARACRLHGARDDQAGRQLREQSLAVIAVAVERVHGFTPHVEQVMGALGLLEGHMIEMATGEGKTVTAAMAAVAAAWRGLPCHVVTANDYLAQRDAELGGHLFGLCRLSVTSVTDGMPPSSRAAAYGHDVVYTTAKELLADFLRDQLILGKTPQRARFSLGQARAGHSGVATMGKEVVLRGLAQVIVDEADSVLIDEAMTPLIISSPHQDDLLAQAAGEAAALARQLQKDEDYTVNALLRHSALTDKGREHLRLHTQGMSPFWRHPERARELVEMALHAQSFLVRDLHYVVEDGKVVLIDELTGRLARQRTLSLGMQQILEACEALPISPPSQVSARLSFQRFFRLFSHVGGMTGTAQEARREFAAAYGLATLPVPTHRPLQRRFLSDALCVDEQAKFDAIVREALGCHAEGRPVLIGMRSVRSSQMLHAHLQRSHPALQVEVLHAVNHEQESAIVARAGRPGAVTIATNMAGRGTDIGLDEGVRAAGGLHVVIGESNDFRRIDRQLAGRCARQGDPGSVRRHLAFDDELMRRFTPPRLLQCWRWQHRHLPWLDSTGTALVLWLTQRRAELQAFRQRRETLKHDLEVDKTGL
ncbi:hypothetical protein, partial [Sphaerotilus sp.]|uniref:preprotein translocase subunit SecA n=1 Tax=Sphaerotilus sp. TaxID=2093942 RepID=UPI0034E29569